TNSLIVFLNYYVFGLLETLFVLLSITVSSLFMKILIRLSPVSRKFE
ncbi:TPA: membrane protein, partial [Enterococcus faecium]|nr:membrane protein [Enterococcus faecium]